MSALVKQFTALFGLALLATYAAAELPQQADDKHLGVATCASSTCHGSVKALEKTRVLQNEYVIWSRQDAHSRGMKTLRNEASQRIAFNLGLAEPAHQAKVCMDCHLDNPEPAAQGRKFTYNDGIGCEACHGGAENWLKSHTNKDRSVEENIAAGMYPTHEPKARAELCLSCHMGTEDKFTTHRIMGAGHPRLSFDLQTFTELQPAHFRLDQDYQQRKNDSDPIQTWIVGVYANAIGWLELLASDWLNPADLFPELAVFDCQACHHPLTDVRWKPRSTKPLPPGSVRIADSHLMMVWALTSALQPAQHEPLKQWLHALHSSSQRSIEQLKAEASAGIGLLRQLQNTQSQELLAEDAQRSLLKRIVHGGKTGLFDDYNAAEQAVFASQLLLRALEPTLYKDKASELFASVASERNYNIGQFRSAMRALDKEL
jgi:hypothetical protein